MWIVAVYFLKEIFQVMYRKISRQDFLRLFKIAIKDCFSSKHCNAINENIF